MITFVISWEVRTESWEVWLPLLLVESWELSKRIFDNLWPFVPICVLYLTLIPKNYAQIIKKIIDEEFVNNLWPFVPICVLFLTLIPKNYAQIIKNEFMNNLWSIPAHLCLIVHTDRTDTTNLNRSLTDKLFMLFVLSLNENL